MVMPRSAAIPEMEFPTTQGRRESKTVPAQALA